MSNINSEELTVTIKVLKVNAKKMTLSVYKQLPRMDIIDNDFNLMGEVWGKVNYHLPKQRTSEKNILWQKGEVLYCCSVSPLHITAEQAIRRFNDDNYGYDDTTFLQKLPHQSLRKAVEEFARHDTSKVTEAFDKYQKVYNYLSSSEQLYIST